jgi:phosphoribosyl-dephospho-CoA transferase
LNATGVLSPSRSPSVSWPVPDAMAWPGWLRRHHLVWAAPAHHAAISAQIADRALAAAAQRLLGAGAPLVIGRQPQAGSSEPCAALSLATGMALPPALGKHRLPFTIPLHAVTRTAPPLKLADTIAHLPPIWRQPLLRLARDAERVRIEFGVYGSAAWEALTGLAYLNAASDIDLLWRPSGLDQLATGIALLLDWETATGLRADGEILFGDHDAVAWREWIDIESQPSSRRVLVKSLAEPRLCTRAEMLACPQEGEAAQCAQAF